MKLPNLQASKILVAYALIACSSSISVNAQQAVTSIVTDYNTYWRTSVSNMNSIKPTNSHNMLAFTYNGTQYSTGVNDLALSSHGETFLAGDFWSLPVDNYSGTVTSNTKVGVGELYDGVHNGHGVVAPINNIPLYLTDGIKGLNIGTCIANLPAGTLTFFISNIQPANIGDGIPDIVVTQVADPSGSTDRYSFVNSAGTIVGNSKDILFDNIAPVANWTADFYEANTNPMTLTSGFTNTDRPVRLWAADLSDFGITAANYQSVSKFKINLSGNSDVAFVAYNNKTFSVSMPLPVTLSAFTATEQNGAGLLTWETRTEKDSRYFVVEKSMDNSDFRVIDTIAAKGNSTDLVAYSYTDRSLATGKTYYRLRMVDIDGQFKYSKTVFIKRASKGTPGLSAYPNPAISTSTITYPMIDRAGTIQVISTSGLPVAKIPVNANSTQTSINVSQLAKGAYIVRLQGAEQVLTQTLIVR